MRRGLTIGLTAGAVLVLLAGGYVTWGSVSGADQDARWDAEVARVVSAADGAESLDVSDDRSVVRVVSGGLDQCSEAEELVVYMELLEAYLAPYGLTAVTVEGAPGGALIAGMVVPEATRDAPVRCEAEKRAQLADAVQRARLAATTFLGSIGAPDDAAGELDSSREAVAHTSVGTVMITVDYGETSGLSVEVARDPVGIDWGAPLRAVGI